MTLGLNPLFPLMLAGAVVFWGTVLYLALRFVRATERRGSGQLELEEPRGRVSRLEQDISMAHTEIERLAAAERFTAQLLATRSTTPGPTT